MQAPARGSRGWRFPDLGGTAPDPRTGVFPTRRPSTKTSERAAGPRSTKIWRKRRGRERLGAGYFGGNRRGFGCRDRAARGIRADPTGCRGRRRLARGKASRATWTRGTAKGAAKPTAAVKRVQRAACASVCGMEARDEAAAVMSSPEALRPGSIPHVRRAPGRRSKRDHPSRDGRSWMASVVGTERHQLADTRGHHQEFSDWNAPEEPVPLAKSQLRFAVVARRELHPQLPKTGDPGAGPDLPVYGNGCKAPGPAAGSSLRPGCWPGRMARRPFSMRRGKMPAARSTCRVDRIKWPRSGPPGSRWRPSLDRGSHRA